jgi:hypothetical protein
MGTGTAIGRRQGVPPTAFIGAETRREFEQHKEIRSK